jgi:predicted AAA+ superfamily ATPase
MFRDKMALLVAWKDAPQRMPLMIKGARQVGKTWLIRELGRSFDDFVEVNFEKRPEAKELFARDLRPERLVSELSAFAGQRLVAGRTLLFLDEIQECPAALASLRYFHEELPELHVAAAGSLLNFVLDKVATGVGRVSYLHVYPMTFGEFLVAAGEGILRERILAQSLSEPLPQTHHAHLLDLVRHYMLLGGMPAVLARYFHDRDIIACLALQNDLITSFLDDFHKYGSLAEIGWLSAVFRSVPVQLGRKFKFVSVDPGVKSVHLARALDLLEMAGVAHRVIHSSADGVPLAARLRSNRFKVVFFDTGLAQRLLNVDLAHWMTQVDIETVNGGALAEQFVGQELAALNDAGPLRPMTYWHREARGASAEVDYLVEKGSTVLPIEVKRGLQGGMKSMHLFLKEKKSTRGVKVSKLGFSDDGTVTSVPFYALERLSRGTADAWLPRSGTAAS